MNLCAALNNPAMSYNMLNFIASTLPFCLIDVSIPFSW